MVRSWFGRLLVSAVVVSVFAAGCGSGGDDSSDSGGSDNSSAASAGEGLEAAREIVEAHQTWNPSSAADVVPGPLTEAPPTDMDVVWMECAVAVCKSIGNYIEEAAEVVGWNLRRVAVGAAQDEIQSAWNSLLSDPPDLVMSAGVDNVQIEQQLDELEALGVPILASSSSDDPGDRNIGVISTLADKEQLAILDAAWVAVDSECDANVVFVTLGDIPVLERKWEAFEGAFGGFCPDAEVELLRTTVADIGKALPSTVVSHLQSNPDTNYIVYGTGSLIAGINQALVEASLAEQVTAVTNAGTEAVWEEIVSGGVLVVDVPNNDAFQGWQMVDRAARYFLGMETTGAGFHEDDGKGTPYMFVTAETIDDPSVVPEGPEGFRDQWRELWLLNS